MRPRVTFDPRRLLAPDLLIALALFLAAAALRVYGVRGSLPYIGHPDEPKLIDAATHIVKTGDLNPHLYIWPSLYTYLEALVIRLHTLWGTFRGYYAGPQSLPDITHIITLAPGVYVWARTFTALLGALSVVVLYFVARDMFNGSRRAGVVAALMLMVSPLHIEYSHYALTDVPLGLVGLLVLWASYNLSRTQPGTAWRSRLFWQAALCGLLVGIATGTKYNGLYVGLVPAVALLMVWLRWRLRWPEGGGRVYLPALVAIPAFAALGFLLCEPYALLDWPSFYNGFTFQVNAYQPASGFGEFQAAVARHLSDLSASDAYFLGPALLGALVLLLNAPVRNRFWLLALFPAFYLLAMSRFYLTYVRNLIITLPFLAVIVGYVVDMAATGLVSMARSALPAFAQDRRVAGVARWALVALALAFIVWEPARVSTAYAAYMGDPESRNLAWQWMQERMRAGDRFAAELHPWQTAAWPDVLAFDVENPDDLHPLTARPPAWYASHGYGYVVLNSNFRVGDRDPATWLAYMKLPVVKSFAGDKEGGKGPQITVLATSGDASGASGLPMMHSSGAKVGDFAALEGYDLAPLASSEALLDPAQGGQAQGEFRAGQALGLNLYFRALRDGHSGDAGWQVWVHLVDAASGVTVAQVDVPPLTGQLKAYPSVVREPHPVAQWRQGELLAGVYNFDLPAGLAPGRYRLETGMWVPPNGPGAPVAPAPGQQGGPGDRIVLGEVSVR